MTAKVKVSDLVAYILEKNKVTSVFGVQGGAVVHIFDSLHRLTDIKVCYNHHEQCSSLAAIANSKLEKKLGVCIVTTGPATTNAMTGLLAAWQDSIPVIFISGQTRREQTSYGMNVRQRGSQECNILDVVKPWTKARILLDESDDIENKIQEMIDIANSPRMGPVWIDIPVNLQWLQVDSTQNNNKKSYENYVLDHKKDINFLRNSIKDSSKPVFVLGRNNFSSESLNSLYKFLRENNIPIVTTWGSAGIVGNNANNIGIIGVSGQQAANFIIRAADLVVFINSHYSSTQAGNNYTPISKNQKFIYINCDSQEIKNLFVKIKSILIKCDSEKFLKLFLNSIKNEVLNKSLIPWSSFSSKLAGELAPDKCAEHLNKKYFLNPHKVISDIYKDLNYKDTVVIDGGGCALYAGFQCLPRDNNFNVICSTSISAMGTGLPELVGASITNTKNRYICVIGDGSLMFNLQELQTLKTNCPPCLILVLNNNGYLAIRHTQSQFLGSRYYGTSPGLNGVEIPNIKKVAESFDYKHILFDKNSNYIETIEKIKNYKLLGHTIVEMIISPEHANLFTASFTKNADETFSPNDIHLMKPFENFDYEKFAKSFDIDLQR